MDAHDGAAPQLAGRYRLGAVLGTGATGVVHAAFDPVLARELAIKLLGPHERDGLPRTTDRDATQSGLLPTGRSPAPPLMTAIDDVRLVEEARALAKVAHPNIASVFDVGVCETGVFIAMELVDGPTLRRWTEATAPDWRAVVAVYLQAGDALAAAHAVGIVHGDFKPDNVLTTARDGVQAKVVDFGLARAIGRVDDATRRDVVFGTPAYLAPECWEDPSREPSADQFAFFVGLCEAIVGRRPYAPSGSLAGLLLRMQAGPELAALRPLAPARLQRAIARGLAVDPAQRFASMTDALAELRSIVADDRRARGRRRMIGAALGIGALGIGGLGLVQVRADAPRRAATEACRAAADGFAAGWNDDARGRIEAAMVQAEPRAGRETAARAFAWLDDYAARGAALRERSCIAAANEPDGLESARDRCFAERAAALAGSIDVLADADAQTVRNAVRTVAELPRIELCDDPAWLSRPRGDAADPQGSAVIERGLARAMQTLHAGRADAVLTQVDTLLAGEPTGTDDTLWKARAQAIRGRAEVVLGHYDVAREQLEASYFVARQLDDEIAAGIAVELAMLFGKLARFEDAQTWVRHAETALASAGGPEREVHARLLSAIAAIEMRRGELDAATTAAERARDLRVSLFGDGHPTVAAAERALGNLLAQADRTAEAMIRFEQARAIDERTLGDDHLDLAGTWHSLGMASTQLGRFDEARAFEQRALAIRQRWLEADHPDIATALVGIAYADLGLLRFDDAEQGFARALAIRETRLGAEHPAVADTLGNLAQVASKRGDCRSAVRALQRAVAIVERAAAAGDLRARVRFGLNLADAYLECRDVPEALARYQAVRTLAEAAPDMYADELARARAGIAASSQ